MQHDPLPPTTPRDLARRSPARYERDGATGTGLLAILDFRRHAGIAPTTPTTRAVNDTGLVAQPRRHATTSPATRSRIAAAMRREIESMPGTGPTTG